MANIKACLSHNKDDWETPADLFEKLDELYRFNIDVCASQENCKKTWFIDKEADALLTSWGVGGQQGRCFMNPPHSKLKAFCKKAYEETQNGNALFVIGLLPARTDTKAFHEYVYGKAQIKFLKGRLKFVGAPSTAPFPSMIVVWGGLV